MLIDTHCHLYPIEYKDSEKIIKECLKKDISIILNGIDKESNFEVIKLSKKYNNVYASIGYDHSTVDKITTQDIQLLEQQIKNNKIIAIGEIGLDYYWVKDNKEKQKELFIKMLDLAEKYNLPIIVHAREAEKDVYEILKNYKLKGSMHCYQGSIEYAKKFIELGYYIGIDGPITYKNNKKIKELLTDIGIENVLVETDSPYLSPELKRKEKNTSLNLIYIIKKVSEILDLEEEYVIKKLEINTKKVFKL